MRLKQKSIMKSFSRMVKTPIKLTLQYLGLLEHTRQIRRVIEMRSYRNIDRFTVTLNDVTVHFSTEDDYSKTWFFPRYAGGHIHEKAVTQTLIEALHSTKCFVDAGAHLGWYTCLAGKHMPDGIVYGFEMDDLNFALLKHNIDINNCTNVEVYNVVVSDSSGMASYKRETKRPSPEFRLEANNKDDESAGLLSVKSVQLDDFLKSREIVPDVVKVDVEEAEMNVLMGMRQTLRNYKPLLFVEIHPDRLHHFNTSTPAILALLMENDYKVFEIENMKIQESMGRLRPLLRDSVMEKKTMLYAKAVD